MDEAVKKKDADSAKKVYAEFDAETKDTGYPNTVKGYRNVILKDMFKSRLPALEQLVESEMKRLNYTDDEKRYLRRTSLYV